MHPRWNTKIDPETVRSRIPLVLAIALFIFSATCVQLTRAVAQTSRPPASASPQPSSAPTASAAPTPATASTQAGKKLLTALPGAGKSTAISATDPQTVTSYLSDVISWYGHLGREAQLVREPGETLYYANSRQTASDILNLAFEYARAQANYIAKTTAKSDTNAAAAVAPSTQAEVPGDITILTRRRDEAAAAIVALQARIKSLQARLATVSGRARSATSSELVTAQSELDLAQARADAVGAILQFEASSRLTDQSGSLAGQIDELDRSIPESERNPKRTGAATAAVAPPRQENTGILGMVSDLLALRRKEQSLDQIIEQTRALSDRASAVRESMLGVLRAIDSQGQALAQSTADADVASLRDRKKAFEALLDQHKLATTAMLPLSKQIVLLGLYNGNLERWRGHVEQRWSGVLRTLVVRLIGIAVVFALIFMGAIAWRWLTDRYVQDIRLRGQVMAARRFVLGLIVAAVLLLNFAGEFGSMATILGFAAAGIAVALQNVILSIAGYFFLIGRFGIKAGDRVQIGGVTGDVVDIGLVKLSLLELGGSGVHRLPTGRVAVFSNAVVFQPNGNFFKQAPGTNFVWNEVRLTLAPDCDYRLAEKRLLDAVDAVFARYRDRVLGDFRRLERELNIVLETPKPQSRLNLTQTGLEMIVRYPADARTAPQITDEVSRRVLDEISREPSLRLAMQGIANIQSQSPPPTADGRAPTEE